MFSRERVDAPALVKAPQLPAALAFRQTAIVRTVVDEIERCERSLERTEHLNLQMIDELRRLARRVNDLADALERENEIEEVEPSGVRLRSSI